MTYLFELGHQPHISTAELEAVFSKINIEIISKKRKGTYFIVETKKEIKPIELIKILGGTIKIAEQITEPGKIIQILANFIKKYQPKGKIHFSVSGDNAKKAALDTKKLLKTEKRSVRYIEAKNSATILHNKLVEYQADFTIIENKIFVTKSIQPFEEFAKRDYERPKSDEKSGMLPPKLARILINLSRITKTDCLLDPFCGSGTILMEAAVLGHENLIGSDKSKKAIQNSKTNLEWIKKEYNLEKLNCKFIVSDIKKLVNHLEDSRINCIITEPYLGKPLIGKENNIKLEIQAEELKNLYKSTFQIFAKILDPGGIVIFIIPRFRYCDDWIKIDCLSNIKKAGFSPLPFLEKQNSLLYWRKKQHLGREIWQFRKN